MATFHPSQTSFPSTASQFWSQSTLPAGRHHQGQADGAVATEHDAGAPEASGCETTPESSSSSSSSPCTTSHLHPLPLRQQPRQRSAGEVTPLRRPLPPAGPLPLKPKRPPNVNLEPFKRFNRGPALPAPRKSDTGSPVSTGRKMSTPGGISPPKPPQRSNKPSRLPRQIALC
ncbi:uncharacterized protein LOC127140261, partial [Lates calcarifer]|uniref:Uncharacterized protein LOC127140261 n=1 Tax=Lates calcarifer TaxID=8187 RepID=A0AAJ8B109_LATCA